MNKRKRWDERKEYCFIYPKICLNLRDSTVEEVSRLYMVLGFVHNYGLGVELLCRGTHFFVRWIGKSGAITGCAVIPSVKCINRNRDGMITCVPATNS